MSQENTLGPLEIVCEAPPYPIVKACNAIGIDTPEDVRWENIDKYELAWRDKYKNMFVFNTPRCVCDSCVVPHLSSFRFTYSSGDNVVYLVGQCSNPKCRTVFWRDK